MKSERGGFRMLRREQVLQGLPSDSYKPGEKLSEPTTCSGCGATYHGGRWSWKASLPGAHKALCPACRRIHEDFPAGYVTIKGEFFTQHRDEILHLIRHCEESEKAEHPLQRLMAIKPSGDGLLVTTTDTHLARNVAEKLHAAFKGDIEFSYSEEDNVLRASLTR